MHAAEVFRIYAKQDAPQHSSKATLTLHSAFTVFPPKAVFFFRGLVTTIVDVIRDMALAEELALKDKDITLST